MSKQDIMEFFYSNSQSFNIRTTASIMLVGLLVGLFIYATYYFCCEKVVYNRKYNVNLVVTVLITTLIMLMISCNVVVSLGMVGALSIVRFRTAVKDSRDTVFMFWAIAEGLCVGTRSYKMVAVSALFIAIVFVVFSKMIGIYMKYVLVIRSNGKTIDNAGVKSILEEAKIKYQVRTSNRNSNSHEYIYEIKVKNELDDKVIDKIMKVDGVDSVNWVIESGETLG